MLHKLHLRSIMKRFFVFSILFFCSIYSKESKSALVAGGSGFLGSHMCERLLEKGYKVICLDNLQTSSKENIAEFEKNPNFTFILHDICNSVEIDVPLDEIYNFACAASPPLYQKDPIHTLKTNVFGTLHLLELAKKTKAKFFQASTSEIYGDPLEHPQKESYRGNVNTIGIRSCYDEGKRCTETLCFDFLRTHDVSVKVARIFNTYGPKMRADDGRVVTNFITQALAKQDLTLYGNGEQTRSFCFVTDLIDAIDSFMQTEKEITGPINLGNPEEFLVIDLAKLILNKTNSCSQMVFYPLPQDDPKMRKPDISLAKETLDWEPKIKLDEGIEKTINYFKLKLK